MTEKAKNLVSGCSHVEAAVFPNPGNRAESTPEVYSLSNSDTFLIDPIGDKNIIAAGVACPQNPKGNCFTGLEHVPAAS